MIWRRAVPVVASVVALAGAGEASAAGLSERAYDETAGVREVLALASIPTVAVPTSPSPFAGSTGGAGAGEKSSRKHGKAAKGAATAATERSTSVRLATATAGIPFDDGDVGVFAVAALALGLCGGALIGGDVLRRWRADPERYDSL